jgi:pimeloyl-ACP methyl ester carboxylesterase
VRTPLLDLAYEEQGPEDGAPVVLLHGFPYDPRCFDDVAPWLAAEGCRVILPYLRGYGPTRFLSAGTLRSGQQAALAADLRDLLDALAIPRAALMGYDWGGRAACILAALWPERVRCLVTGDGYNIQNIPRSGLPAAPWVEHQLWYQYYFHAPRGRAGLEAHRRDLARLLWRLWSPSWTFDEDTFGRTAPAFDNPDFVDVVIHSYRHRYGYAEGDPALLPIERALEAQPAIPVPTISLCGASCGMLWPTPASTRRS